MCMNEVRDLTLDPAFFDVPPPVRDISFSSVPTAKALAAVDISWNLPLPEQKRLAVPLGGPLSKDYKTGDTGTSSMPIIKLPYYRQVKLDCIEWTNQNRQRKPEEREPRSNLHKSGWTTTPATLPGWQTLSFYNSDVIPPPPILNNSQAYVHPHNSNQDLSLIHI